MNSQRMSVSLLCMIIALFYTQAASAATLNITLSGVVASGLGDCTPSGAGQCNGTPPDPPVEINSIGIPDWGNGLPFDMAKLPGVTLGPITMQLPGTVVIPMPAGFAYMAGGTGGGSGGPEPTGCGPTEGGVTTPFTVQRSITVNGVQQSFQQSGSIFVGWCYDIVTMNSVSVNVDTGQGILTVNVGGTGAVISGGQTSVGLISPVPGATLTAPANVTLAATATTRIGTIGKVEFYRGTTLIATVTSPPYTATDTGVAAGTYAYSAMAYNDQDENYYPLVSPDYSVTVSAGGASTQVFYIHADHLNTPRAVTNAAGTAVWKW